MPAGHLATAYLVARRDRAERVRRFVPLAVGVLLPDLVDKSLLASGWTPYGRTVAHSAWVWLVVAFGAWLWARGRRRAVSWVVLGGLLHLLVDPLDDVAEGIVFGGYVFSAWAGWPWSNPDMLSVQIPALAPPTRWLTTGLELATALSTAWLVTMDGRDAS